MLGRANKMLAKGVTGIATSFAATKYLAPELADKARLTGNPVRTLGDRGSQAPFSPPAPQGRLSLLVFGGSQGARYFSEAVPPALALLPMEIRHRLRSRAAGAGRGRRGVWPRPIAPAGITAEVSHFFADLPERMAKSHLVVGSLRRLDGRRINGDRAPGHSGSAAARARQ